MVWQRAAIPVAPWSLGLKLPYEDRLSYQSRLFLIQQKLHTLMLCSKPLILSKVKREATQKKAAQEQIIFFRFLKSFL